MDKQFDQSLLYLFIFRLCFLYSVQLVFNKLLVIYLFIYFLSKALEPRRRKDNRTIN